MEDLPRSFQKQLKDFIYVPFGTYTPELDRRQDGLDSFSIFIVPVTRTVNSFYIQNAEVSVHDYMEFARSTQFPHFMPDTSKWPYGDYLLVGGGVVEYIYFSHPAYAEYPIVCVSYEQALGYCRWKSEQVNKLLNQLDPKTEFKVRFTLPHSFEWEHAAITDYYEQYKNHFNARNVFLRGEVNIGRTRDHNDVLIQHEAGDGFFLTAPVKENRRKVRLNHIMGNVAEWTKGTIEHQYTRTPYLLDSEHVVHLYPLFAHGHVKDTITLTGRRKTVMDTSYKICKGGSWNHGMYYCNPSAILPVHQKSQEPWLGFRMVMHIYKKTGWYSEFLE